MSSFFKLSAGVTLRSVCLPTLPCRDLRRAAKGEVREDRQHRSLRFLLPCLRLEAAAEAKQETQTASDEQQLGAGVCSAMVGKFCRALWGALDLAAFWGWAVDSQVVLPRACPGAQLGHAC